VPRTSAADANAAPAVTKPRREAATIECGAGACLRTRGLLYDANRSWGKDLSPRLPSGAARDGPFPFEGTGRRPGARNSGGGSLAKISVDPGLEVNCEVADYLWPWDRSTPVLMQHGFCRNASFWRRWVPILSERRRVYRTEMRGCGGSDVPPPGCRFD